MPKKQRIIQTLVVFHKLNWLSLHHDVLLGRLGVTLWKELFLDGEFDSTPISAKISEALTLQGWHFSYLDKV